MTEPQDRHHHHHHGHPHHNHHEKRSGNLSFEDKLVKRIEHWIGHNTDHASTYREWADQTARHGFPVVSDLLEKAALATDDLSRLLEAALDEVQSGKA
jgi:hypothetical protein